MEVEWINNKIYLCQHVKHFYIFSILCCPWDEKSGWETCQIHISWIVNTWNTFHDKVTRGAQSNQYQTYDIMFGIDLWHVECNLVTREILGWHVECITYTWDASMTRNVLLWHVSYMNVTCSQHVKYKYLTCFDTWATGNSRVMTRVLHLQHVRYMPKICTISLYYKYLTRFTMWVTIYLHIMTCVLRILQARSSFPFSSVTKGYIFTQTEGSHILSHQREWMHKISRVLR